MAEKSKRRALSIQDKFNIITEIETGSSQTTISSKMKIGKSTVSTIWKNKNKIKRDYNEGMINLNKKKMRTSTHNNVDHMLLKWFQQKRANNVPVSGQLLQLKAEEFGRNCGDEFKCSSGWLDRFKKRHNIVFGRISGEAASVNRSVTENWLLHTWPSIKMGYSENQIFNADETGIFYRMPPNQTHKFKGETCIGGKLSKERITALVCANWSGTEKRKLLIIGE